ncbi:hypothetical protein CNY89_16105, partial [Amaricoccus sp. HAR-UPW-R2A-40]
GLAASSLFPALMMGIFSKRVNKEGAIAGMLVGESVEGRGAQATGGVEFGEYPTVRTPEGNGIGAGAQPQASTRILGQGIVGISGDEQDQRRAAVLGKGPGIEIGEDDLRIHGRRRLGRRRSCGAERRSRQKQPSCAAHRLFPSKRRPRRTRTTSADYIGSMRIGATRLT